MVVRRRWWLIRGGVVAWLCQGLDGLGRVLVTANAVRCLVPRMCLLVIRMISIHLFPSCRGRRRVLA